MTRVIQCDVWSGGTVNKTYWFPGLDDFAINEIGRLLADGCILILNEAEKIERPETIDDLLSQIPNDMYLQFGALVKTADGWQSLGGINVFSTERDVSVFSAEQGSMMDQLREIVRWCKEKQ